MYKKIIAEKIYDYLKLKNWEMKKSGKLVMLQCPECNKMPFTASIIPNVNEVHCIPCNEDYNITDFVRLLEPEYEDANEDDIYDHLKKLLNVQVQTDNDKTTNAELFEMYKNNGFSLTPLYKNSHDGGRPQFGKAPIEGEWQITKHKDPLEWESWIDKGLNLGMVCKLSKKTIIDIDAMPKAIKDKIYSGKATEDEKKQAILESNKILEETLDLLGHPEKLTMHQKTFGGMHIIFNHVEEFRKTRINELSIDIEHNEGQVVVEPSKIGGTTRKMIGDKVVDIPEDLKKFLLEKINKFNSKQTEKDSSEESTEEPKIEMVNFGLVPKGQGRSEYLTKMMGIMRQQFDERTTRSIIISLNKTHCYPPIPLEGLEETVLKSLRSYNKGDLYFLKKKILDFLETAERGRTDEIELAVFSTRVKGADKMRLSRVLVELIKEDKITRKKNEYFMIKYANWQTSLINASKPLPFKVPYFDPTAYFKWGQHLLIGGQSGSGKTHLAMNIIHRLIKQGIKPKLFESEPGKNFIDIALRLGFKEGEFEYDDETAFYEVDFDKNSVIIIDWINPVDYAKTDQLFRQLNQKLLKSNSFLISFMQLKKTKINGEEDGWFAPNLVDLYPAFAARFLLMDKKQDREHGHFIIDKANSPKFPRIWDMPTKYFNQTCEVKLIEEIKEEK